MSYFFSVHPSPPTTRPLLIDLQLPLLINSHLLASKLFKLPQHSLINFDVLSEKDKERSDGEKQEAPQQDMDDFSSRFNVAALKRSRRKRKSVLKEINRSSSRGYSFDDVTDGGSFPSSATADEESDDDDSISDQTTDKDPKHSDPLQGTATICGDLQVRDISLRTHYSHIYYDQSINCTCIRLTAQVSRIIEVR